MKRCPHCGENKLLGQFNKNRANHDGVASWCKECKRPEHQKYKKRNREKYNEMNKKWYQRHKTEIKARVKRRYYEKKMNDQIFL